ncbi:MAG: signal recognition particle-docking protein FtsY [Holophagales bacterium]|nr:signal recognition particle-docking protein FtsY [Holophagales bacterium]
MADQNEIDDELDLDDPDDRFELAPETQFPFEQEKKGFWKKLKKGLFMTHSELLDRMDAAVSGRAVLDDETLEYLEESLIAADLGVETSLELVEKVKEGVRPGETRDIFRIREILTDEVSVLLMDAPRPAATTGPGPAVTLVRGVNGVGKTTTIAKLARWHQQRGEKVLLAAGDTFRAAAIEQITLWGERLGVDVIRQNAGGDPAAVVFDALHAAKARKARHLIVDTAGRLHTKEYLMKELGKIRRVIEREAADWPVTTLLVLDATTGHNAVTQAKEFARVVDVDGVVLTKIDGTAKGGMAVAVARELRLPIVFLGVGEKAEDLVEFRPREFAHALFQSA